MRWRLLVSELHVDLKERVNAVYHLACLARTIGCTTDAFERFWKEPLGWTDAIILQRYIELQGQLQRAIAVVKVLG